MTEIIIKAGNKQHQKTARSILQEAIVRERKIMQTALLRTKEKLAEFEKQYQLNSETFYSRYQSGGLDDRNDYIDWAGEYQIAKELGNQLELLEELVLCK